MKKYICTSEEWKEIYGAAWLEQCVKTAEEGYSGHDGCGCGCFSVPSPPWTKKGMLLIPGSGGSYWVSVEHAQRANFITEEEYEELSKKNK